MFECVCLLLPGRFDWMWHSFSSHIFLDQLCVFSIGKTMVLWLLEKPVVMYWCESWTIKKSECWRIDAFELWCWRRPLRVHWMARRSNQSILKEINHVYSLEGLMLKRQYFGHLIWIADIRKDPDAGKDWRQEERGRQKTRWLGGITDSTDMGLGSWWWIGRPDVLRFMGL